MERNNPSCGDTTDTGAEVNALIASAQAISDAHELFMEAHRRLAARTSSTAAWRIRRRAPQYLTPVTANVRLAAEVYSTVFRSLLDRLHRVGIPPHVITHPALPPQHIMPAIRDIRAALIDARTALPQAARTLPADFPERRCLEAVDGCLADALDALPQPFPPPPAQADTVDMEAP